MRSPKQGELQRRNIFLSKELLSPIHTLALNVDWWVQFNLQLYTHVTILMWDGGKSHSSNFKELMEGHHCSPVTECKEILGQIDEL